MRKLYCSYYMPLFCVCLSVICCKAQTGIGASDAKAAGFEGPVKKVVLHYFKVKNKDTIPSNEETFAFDQHTNLLIISVSSYDRQGRAIRMEEENYTGQPGPPVRDYQIIKNGLGKKYDDLNRPIGHSIQSWSNRQTLVYKNFDSDNRLQAEAVRHYDSYFRQDSCIISYEDGSFRKIRNYYRYMGGTITVSSNRSDAEGHNTVSGDTLHIETKDRYGNVLRQTSISDDGQQYIMEYEYTYYDTPEETRETAAEKMLLPDNQYPRAGIYEAEKEDGYLRLCLFANGRYCFEIMSNQLLTGSRGSYREGEAQQITFQPDRADTPRFYVYGRHNTALPTDKQHIYFFDNGRAPMEYMLFATNIRPFDATYNNVYPLKKVKGDWYIKETDKNTDRSLWLYEVLISRSLYRFDFSGPYNEWRVLQNAEIGKEAVDFFLRGTVTEEGIQATLSLSQDNKKEWQTMGIFSKKAVSILPRFLAGMQPEEPREIFVEGQSYKRIYANQVSSVKDGQLRYEITPDPDSNVEKVIELKMKDKK